MLLRDMGFKAGFVLAESAAATASCGFPTACVVHLGDQTSTVACVEEVCYILYLLMYVFYCLFGRV